jgi:hypothetical protein
MSSVTVDFDIYPRQIMSGQTIRCFDKTDASGIAEWYAAWVIEENKAWTVSTPTSTHINLATASTFFAVDDCVVVKSSAADLPAGLSAAPIVYYVVTATTTYLEISATKGGAAVSYTDAGTGTLTISHAAKYLWNPLIKPCPVTTTTDLDVTLYLYDFGPTLHTLTKTAVLRIYPAATAVSKPTSASIYGRVSIFIYDSTNATAINRMKTTNNNLFFQDLKVTGSMNKAGNASFKVYNPGGATATEIGLMTADKNVAIISGRNVIWSGKILKATQEKIALFDVASPFMSWQLDCESDIGKMRLQKVKTANQTTYRATPGYIVNKIVENSAATDIDWRGLVEKSLISFEGIEMAFTVTDADMYSQFMSLANITGFDWRTRNNWLKYLYGASGYSSASKTVTLSAIAPYTTNSFAGRWLLFVNSTNADTTANIVGIRAYGKIASNTTTVITLSSITNDTIPPASSEYVIILGDPVLDFASDLRQPDYQCTFTANKARAAALQNAYEMNDKSDFKNIVTVPTAKANTKTPLIGFQSPSSVTLYAKDVWDDQTNFFSKSTYLTRQYLGWVYSYAANATSIVLIGQDLALQNGGDMRFYAVHADGGLVDASGTINATPTEQVQADGTPTTTISFASALDTSDWMRYSLWKSMRMFVKSDALVGPSGQLYVGIGNEVYSGTNLDNVYGVYYVLTASGAWNTPHYPGCIVSTRDYTPAAPATGSPMDLFGIICKTFPVDVNAYLPDLEVYATNLLLNHSLYYKKGGLWAFIYDWFKTDLRPTNQVTEAGFIIEGEEIAALQNTGDTALDVEYDQYKNQWQVLGWTLDGNQMIVTLELGDFERNTNTLINDKTTGINYTIT